MPAAIINGKLEKKCEICGGSAYFGHDVNFLIAVTELRAGNIDRAKKHLGKWYCGMGKMCKNERNNDGDR